MDHASAAAVLTDPQRDAETFWRRMALESEPADAPRPHSTRPSAEVRAALRLLEDSAAGSPKGGPSVPSAGALHPYEQFVITAGAAGPELFAVDVARRTCELLASATPVTRALTAGGIHLPGPGAFLVLTVVRPWLSMRKYGDRGYLYAQLDAAHLGTHLLALGNAGHRRAEWLVRSRAAETLSDLLHLADRCCFVHSILLLDEPADQEDRPAGSWRCYDSRHLGRITRTPNHQETRCWAGLARHGKPVAGGRPPAVHRTALMSGGRPADAAEVATRLSDLARLSAQRRSAKDFAEADLPADALQDALAALGTPLSTDLSSSDAFGATLVARRVTGLAPGSYPIRDARIGVARVADAALPGDDLVRICMGQEHLRHGCAAVVFHGRRRDLFRSGMAELDEAVTRAGALAHLLYLGATRAGIAITTIGGFDAGQWHAAAGLSGDDEVLYVAMLGVSGTSPVKLDRLQRAYAHDER